jgi:hypothetical protein
MNYMKWTVYSIIVAFATYWLANLLLWYPWSYSATLGMILMFLAITPIWFYSIYNCLKRHNGEKPIRKAIYTSFIFSLITIVSDYAFYGIIRDAMTELYHPTTLYGYAFLMALPFIEIKLYKRKLKRKTEIKNKEFFGFSLLGLISLLAITFIVIYDIRISKPTFQFITLIIASLFVFNLVLWISLGTHKFISNINRIALLSFLCVIIGMLIGKSGANLGLKWWIYYPAPVFLNVLLPPIILKMNKKQLVSYLILIILSAPFIHFIFSFFVNWTEYMPFMEIPYYKTLLN